MNAITHANARAGPAVPHRAPDPDAIRALYAETQADFFAWSSGGNMHFGYWERGMSPLAREAMLERLNQRAIGELRLESLAVPTPHVADLGCGAGATARAIARRPERPIVIAVTLVRESIALAQRLDRAAGLSLRIAYALCDLAETWMASATMDAAVAIESFCYAPGEDKSAAVREAARLLKPGARLVVVDGFLAREPPRGALGWIYRRWCECWAVPQLANLAAFERALRANGFEEVEVTDLFWHAAPSALHIPWVAMRHTVRELWKSRGHISTWRWRHIAASWLSLALGIARGRFRYCMVTATRARPN